MAANVEPEVLDLAMRKSEKDRVGTDVVDRWCFPDRARGRRAEVSDGAIPVVCGGCSTAYRVDPPGSTCAQRCGDGHQRSHRVSATRAEARARHNPLRSRPAGMRVFGGFYRVLHVPPASCRPFSTTDDGEGTGEHIESGRPPRYTAAAACVLSTGFVVWLSPTGPQLSPHLDIIIYDAIRSGPPVRLNTCHVFPLEAVNGYVGSESFTRQFVG